MRALIVKFVLGQGLLQVMSLILGMLLVRVLPVEQYALYTVAGTMLAIVSIGSNFGLGQAIVSIGARRRSDALYVGALWVAARSISSYLYLLAAFSVLTLWALVFRSPEWSLFSQLASVALVLAIGFLQIDTALSRAVLNMNHDSASIFRLGFAEISVRLALVLTCLIWPVAVVALAANLLGASAARIVALARIQRQIDRGQKVTSQQGKQLKSFVIPLVPMFLYSLFQGQVAILVLSSHANTIAIAEVGALSRLGQLFMVPMMLNPFFVQPLYARISSLRAFLVKIGQLLIALALLTVVVLGSAMAAPQLWLLILGSSYAHLTIELPILVSTSLAAVVGGTLYTVVISRGETGGQSLCIVPCLGGQLALIVYHGLGSSWTTAEALVLGLVPALAYVACQILLLVRVIYRWSLQPEFNQSI